jgi:hypothetical protein
VAKDEPPLFVRPGDDLYFLNQMVLAQAYAAVGTHGNRILGLAGLGMLKALHGYHLLSQIICHSEQPKGAQVPHARLFAITQYDEGYLLTWLSRLNKGRALYQSHWLISH